jgi:hypothetical protein
LASERGIFNAGRQKKAPPCRHLRGDVTIVREPLPLGRDPVLRWLRRLWGDRCPRLGSPRDCPPSSAARQIGAYAGAVTPSSFGPLQLSSSGLSRGPISPLAPEPVEAWMAGPSPTMTEERMRQIGTSPAEGRAYHYQNLSKLPSWWPSEARRLRPSRRCQNRTDDDRLCGRTWNRRGS